MAVDPKFVDVDLKIEAEKLNIPLGYEGRPNLSKFCRSTFGDVEELIPESKWKEWALKIEEAKAGNEYLLSRIYNQQNEGSCVGNMGGQFFEFLWNRTFGKKQNIPISAISMYKQIGFSPNSGASIEDCLRRGLDTGFLPLDTPENRVFLESKSLPSTHVMPHTGFRTPWPNGWKSTAKFFRFHEFFTINNRKELFSALLKGFCVGVGRAGHSILYVRLIWDGTRWLVLYVNSWGKWGVAAGDFDAGFGYDSARLIDSSADYAWTARSVYVPSWMAPLTLAA